MSAGTKIFLAVFGLMIGAMVLYYTTVGDGEGDPPVVRGSEDPLVAKAEPVGQAASERKGIVRERRSSTPAPRQRPPAAKPALPAPDLGAGSAGAKPAASIKKKDAPESILAGLPPFEGSPARPPKPAATERAGTTKAEGLAAVNLAEMAKRAQTPPATDRKPQTRPKRPQFTDYFVRPGDTLSSIAAAWFGDANKWDLIGKANPTVDPNRLQPGDLLRLPDKSVAAASASPRAPVANEKGTHLVRSGESLSSIAGQVYGDETRWRELYDANRRVIGPDPHRLAVGMKLVVPD